MLKGKNIICISQTTWHGEFTKSTVQLLSLLAKNNNVVFIEYPFTVKGSPIKHKAMDGLHYYTFALWEIL